MNMQQSPLYAEVRNFDMDEKSPPTVRLTSLRGAKIVRAILDFVLASVAFLFFIFGFLVYRNDGKPPLPGTQAELVVNIAQYGPTVFPVLFAAIVGGAMKAIATWKLQRGATYGVIEQLIGSISISGAFLTQAQLLAFNFTALLIIILWSLSPVGSQAALRVVSVVRSFPSNTTTLTAMDTFAQYQFGAAENLAEAYTTVSSPVIAAMMSAFLLKDRNQDVWGNLRLPAIERLTSDDNPDWVTVANNPVTGPWSYPSIVGIPFLGLPSVGNSTFTLSGSYLNLTCPVLEMRPQYTNFTTIPPAINSRSDCRWISSISPDNSFQIALSAPCDAPLIGNGTRQARRLIWESFNYTQGAGVTHAECELRTSYVDTNLLCVGTACAPSAVRRTPHPPRDRNWTVFDFENGVESVGGFLQLLTHLFPHAAESGGYSPTVSYMANPYNAVTVENRTSLDLVGSSLFELRLTQLMNAQLIIGVSPAQLTGSFNPSNKGNFKFSTVDVPATTAVEEDIIRCNRGWLATLIISSSVLFILAGVAAVLRFITLVPDILGTLSLGVLANRTQELEGNSAWSGVQRAVALRNVRMRLGDINPGQEVGRIALAAPLENATVTRVQKGRYYR
ncbi:hypothetical protein F5884DRAFT_442661 [Xylogone sp. PMI_703]|nr:hypothetical protein F5884DRAFT_442661 [Xylogone sp. PMI_703]